MAQKDELEAALGRSGLEEMERAGGVDMWRNPGLDDHPPPSVTGGGNTPFSDLAAANNFPQHFFQTNNAAAAVAAAQQQQLSAAGVQVRPLQWPDQGNAGSPFLQLAPCSS